MSFSIFDLYQSPSESPQPSQSLKNVHFRFRETKNETPDSMRWEEDEEPGQRASPCAGLERRKGERPSREESSLDSFWCPAQPRLEESFAPAIHLEAANDPQLPMMRRKSIYGTFDDVSKESRHWGNIVETHSYTENKKYWDWLNSRNEKLKSLRKTASKPLFAQTQAPKGRKTMPDVLGKEEAPVRLPRKASVGDLQKLPVKAMEQNCSLDISRSCLPATGPKPKQRKSLPVLNFQECQGSTSEFNLTLAGTGSGFDRLNRRYKTVAKKLQPEASPVLNQGGRNVSFAQLGKLTMGQSSTFLHPKRDCPKKF